MSRPTSLALPLVLLLCSTPLLAQAAFVAPRVESLYTQLSEDAENARWQWGSFRVQPSIGLGSLEYVDDTFIDADDQGAQAQDDIQVTAFAGLSLYQLLGEGSAFGISIRPNYAWWNENSDRSRFNTVVQASAALSYGRFFLDGEAGRNEQLGVATQEAEQLINFGVDTFDVLFGAEVYRSLAIVAQYERRETDHLLGERPSELVPDFTRLDQTIESVFAGLQVQPGRYATVSVGVVEESTEAANTARDYDGDGFRLGFTYKREGLEISAQVRNLDLEPTQGSAFTARSFTDGHAALRLGSALGRNLTLYTDTGLIASVRSQLAGFESTRYGVRSTLPLGLRTALQLGYEIGERDFEESPRNDDTTLLNAGLTLKVLQNIALSATFTRTELESNQADFNREFDRFKVGLSIGLSGFSWP